MSTTSGINSNPLLNATTSSKAPATVTQDLAELFNKQMEKREVSANIDAKSGTMASTVESEGDKKIFDTESKKLGKQDFLNLLVTQLKYQDPLSPSENTEFVAQLAQFSSLEGTQNIGESVDKLNSNLQTMIDKQKESANTMSQATAVSLIGKQARVKLDTVDWDPAKKKPLTFQVHAPLGKDVLVAISDSKDKAINFVEVAGGGDKKLAWSGDKMDGSSAGKGTYNIHVVTAEDLMTDVGYAYLEDRVTAIDYTSGGSRLTIGGQDVPFEKVASLLDEVETTTSKP